MEIFKANTVFFSIYESKLPHYQLRREAYEAAEKEFGERLETVFGMPFRKFKDYETFLSSYNREVRCFLNTNK